MIWIFSNIWSNEIVDEEYSEFPKLINNYVSKYCETNLNGVFEVENVNDLFVYILTKIALPRVFGPNSKKDKKFKQAIENYMSSGLDKIDYFDLKNVFK
ncbi:hypothetical protein AYI69_g412 [Smittium culicis]|uniref:Uncharacterized protein n=1 Tax=Smittium culicis TaxID=133412 RepID=A0A1R1YT33_9FUNG|nr:hypothetical protein AYI69_g412 [Smittium culicis]